MAHQCVSTTTAAIFLEGKSQGKTDFLKGDHCHVRGKEREYRFKNAEQLLADFWSDVEEMLK